MPFKIDFRDGDVLEWGTQATGAEYSRVSDYTPRIYIGVRDENYRALDRLDRELRDDPKIVRIERERWFKDLRSEDRSTVLRADLERVDEIDTTAHEIRRIREAPGRAPGSFQLYNIDFSQEFRYCLETGTDPTPSSDLSMLRFHIDEKPLADRDLTALRVDGELIGNTRDAVLEGVVDELERIDPDVLLVNTAQIVPLLYDAAEECAADWFDLGRLSGYQQLAGASTFESYGMRGHSPARFNIPGRVILDESNSFLWNKAGFQGLLDLTERSWKPLQESGWASIGNLLTAIQIREAYRHRDVLIPWDKFEAEYFKHKSTLHAADRGGMIFDPRPGLYENVHGLDFSSLYPNIMIEYNVSPETVLCNCHPDGQTVPEIGYNICEEGGLIPDVLEPIVRDRDSIKAAIRETEDPEELTRLEERSDALKWILVTCFGYQGYKNSKFGRIEAHEAINAYAREFLLQTKEAFEAGGWEIIHGIVDSIWVRAMDDREQRPLEEIAAEISEQVGIRLEYEAAFDWLCLVPKRGKKTGALTKYFGWYSDGYGGEDDLKIRGIEYRQRSTPTFISEVQRDLMDVLDRYREPEAVCDRLQTYLSHLRLGNVDPSELIFRNRATKKLDNYRQGTHVVSALKRYERAGVEKGPGQDVEYIVVDDDARLAERVRLPFEEADSYDTELYSRELVRAAESIVSPFGWEREDIRRYLRDTTDAKLHAF